MAGDRRTSSQAMSIQAFLLRELKSLRLELQAYANDEQVWLLPAGLPNSGGTLALHLAGNLQHYIGTLLGGTGYHRDREREFTARGLRRAELVAEIEAAERAIAATLPRLTDEDLALPYPETIRGATIDTGEMLIQLGVHLAYHLGQISYHRRLVTGDPAGVGALPAGELRSARLLQLPPL